MKKRLVCINNTRDETDVVFLNSITPGKVYELSGIDFREPVTIEIIDNTGEKFWYLREWFLTIEEWREYKLNCILQ